jgi:hypothetical protein
VSPFYLQWKTPAGRTVVRRYWYTGNAAQAGHTERSWKIVVINRGHKAGLRECREVGEAEWREFLQLPRAAADMLELQDLVLRARVRIRSGGFRGLGLFEDLDRGVFYITQAGRVQEISPRSEWARDRYAACRERAAAG